MTDSGIEAKCHKCGAEPGAVCRTPKGAVHKHGTHDGRGRQLTDGTVHYYTPTQVRNLIHDAIKAEREKSAKVCEDYGASYDNAWNQKLGVANDLKDACDECAAAIRARGE